ncbi:MAG: filamentous hemagglutinin N-terminal domain-containing protein [Alphaproteobacteria bacterium]
MGKKFGFFWAVVALVFWVGTPQANDGTTQTAAPEIAVTPKAPEAVAPSMPEAAIPVINITLAPPAPDALPQGADVRHGQADFAYSPNNLDVKTHTDLTRINWKSFDVGAQARVGFDQPSPQAVTVNEVLEQKMSHIAGRIDVNQGLVYITNPYGMVYHDGAVIDGHVVASTYRLNQEAFDKRGEMLFEPVHGIDGEISVEGKVTVRGPTAEQGGLMGIIAPYFTNKGHILGELSTIEVASGGEKVRVAFNRDKRIQFTVDGTAKGAKISATKGSKIEGKEIVMTVGAVEKVLDHAIRIDGELKATGLVEGEGGKIFLDGGESGQLSMEGKLDASGTEKGGQVVLQGKKISMGVEQDSVINASGKEGGEVLLGIHEYDSPAPGRNEGRVKTSHTDDVILGKKALIDASGTEKDGGHIVTYGRESVLLEKGDHSYSLAARSEGGKGGFIETSSKNVELLGHGDVSSGVGSKSAGQFYLDPISIFIQDDTGGSNIYSSGWVYDQLQLGDLTLSTGIGSDLSANESITINASIGDWGAKTLSFIAEKITINAPITNYSSGTLNLRGHRSGEVHLAYNSIEFGAGYDDGDPGSIYFGNGGFIKTFTANGQDISDYVTVGSQYQAYTNIYTAAQLAAMTSGTGSPNNFYAVATDIDLSAYNGGVWTPLDLSYVVITGDDLNGGSYKIQNMNVTGLDGSNNAGFVGTGGYGPNFDHLIFENPSITVTNPSSVGILGGNLYASTIKNCSVIASGDIINVTNTNASASNMYVGGLVGNLYRSSIQNSYVNGNVVMTNTAAATGLTVMMGSVFGEAYQGNADQSFSTGNVKVHNQGDASLGTLSIGGFAGDININGGSISDSFSLSNVTVDNGGDDSHGSIDTLNVGGFIGSNGNTISTSYFAGNISVTAQDTNAQNLHGFAGNNSGTIGSAYFYVDPLALIEDPNATKLTAAQMSDIHNFSGGEWGTRSTWKGGHDSYSNGRSLYPYLVNTGVPVPVAVAVDRVYPVITYSRGLVVPQITTTILDADGDNLAVSQNQYFVPPKAVFLSTTGGGNPMVGEFNSNGEPLVPNFYYGGQSFIGSLDGLVWETAMVGDSSSNFNAQQFYLQDGDLSFKGGEWAHEYTLQGDLTNLRTFTSSDPTTTGLLSGTITTRGGQHHGVISVVRDSTLTSTNTDGDYQYPAGFLSFHSPIDNDGDSPPVALTLEVHSGNGINLFSDATVATVGATHPLGSLTTNGNHPFNLYSNTITTTGDQTYNGWIQLNSNATLTGDNITFNNKIDGTYQFTVVPTTMATFHDLVGVWNNSLSSLIVNGPSTFAIQQYYWDWPTVQTSGSSNFDGSDYGQIYQNAVTLGYDQYFQTNGSSILLGNGSGSAGVNGDNHSLTSMNGNVTAADGTTWGNMTLSVTGAVSVGDLTMSGVNISTTAGQTYAGALVITDDTNLTDNSGSGIQFISGSVNGSADGVGSLTLTENGESFINISAPIGQTHPIYSIGTNGSLIINRSIATSGASGSDVDQNYGNAVAIGNYEITLSGANITFGSTIDPYSANGSQILTLTTSGTAGTTFSSTVGSDALGQLIVNGGLNIAGSAGNSITTVGGQTYHGPVSLVAVDQHDTDFGTINLTDSSSITFNGTIDRGDAPSQILNISVGNGDGTVTFNGNVGGSSPLFTLNIIGPTHIDGVSITTTGVGSSIVDQTYNGPVVLGAVLSMPGRVGRAYVPSTSSLSGVNINFLSTVDGGHPLAVSTSGDTGVTFGDLVGDDTYLDSLYVTGSAVIGNNISTAGGGQTYAGPVTLLNTESNMTTFTDTERLYLGVSNPNGRFGTPVGAVANAIIFNSAVDGSEDGTQGLTVNATKFVENFLSNGTVSFNGGVGQSYSFPSLTTTAGTSTTISENVGSPVDTNAGPIGYLEINSPTILGGDIYTVDGQNYNGSVSLTSDVTVQDQSVDSGSSIVNFNGTIDSFDGDAQSLTVISDSEGAGTVNFYGDIGYTNVLNTLNVTGTSIFGGNWVIWQPGQLESSQHFGFVNTVGSQTYNGPVQLGVDMWFEDNNSDRSLSSVVFNSTVDGIDDINFSFKSGSSVQSLVLGSGVGNNWPSDSAIGTITVGPVGTHVAIGVIFTFGNATFKGDIGTSTMPVALVLAGLELADNTEVTTLEGNVYTIFGQEYIGPVLLGAPSVTLTNFSDNSILFNSTIDSVTPGGSDLVLNPSGGGVSFGGNVGANAPLSSITVNGNSEISDDNPGDSFSFYTTGNQTYNGTFTNSNPENASFVAGVYPSSLYILEHPSDGFSSSLNTIGRNGSFSINGGGSANWNGNILTLSDFNSHRFMIFPGEGVVQGPQIPSQIPSLNGTPATSVLVVNTGLGAVVGNDSISSGSGIVVGDGQSINWDPESNLIVFTGLNGAHYTLIDADTGLNVDIGSNSQDVAVPTYPGTVTFGGQVDLGSVTVGSSDLPSTVSLSAPVNTGMGQTYYGRVVLNTSDDTTTPSYTIGLTDSNSDPTSSFVTFNSTVDGNPDAYQQSLVVTANSDSPNGVTFGGYVGSTTSLNTLFVTGTVHMNAGTNQGDTTTVTTAGDQTYNQRIILGADAIINAAGTVTFAGVTDDHSLTVNAPTTIINDAIYELDNLSVINGDGVTLLGSNVTTYGNQNYYGTILLGAPGGFTLTAGDTVSLQGGVNDNIAGYDLSIHQWYNSNKYQGGSLQLGGDFSFGIFNVPGVDLGGPRWSDPIITLIADTTFNFDPESIQGILGLANGGNAFTGGGHTLTVEPAITFPTYIAGPDHAGFNGNLIFSSDVILDANTAIKVVDGSSVTFSGNVDGPYDFTVNTNSTGSGMGNILFNGSVGYASSLSSLTVTGNTTLEGNVRTAGGQQSYIGPVTINNPITLDTADDGDAQGANISFSDSINSAGEGDYSANFDLNIFAGVGTVSTGSDVGSSYSLGNFAVHSEAINLGGNVTTVGGQSYNGNVTLTNNVMLRDNNDNLENSFIQFSANLDSDGIDGSSNYRNLRIQADSSGGTGSVTLGTVGDAYKLGSLTIVGNAILNGSISTVGGQTYNQTVQLNAINPYLVTLSDQNGDSLGASYIFFYDSVDTNRSQPDDPYQSLTVMAGTNEQPGIVTFGNGIGNWNQLNVLTVTGAAQIGGNMTASGGQTYNGPVSIIDNSIGDDNDPETISINFDTTDGGNNSTGADITFNSTVDGYDGDSDDTTNIAVTAGTEGTVTFAADVGTNFALSNFTVVGQTINLSGNVTTTGGQEYNGAVSLNNSLQLTDTSTNSPGGTISFDSTVDGAHDLTVSTPFSTEIWVEFDGGGGEYVPQLQSGGTANFVGNVGGMSILNSLDVSSGALINLGGNVTTAGTQIYRGPVVLNGDVSLDTTSDGDANGSNATFLSTVNSLEDLDYNLTVNVGTEGTATFDDSVGAQVSLNALQVTGAAILTGDVYTAGGQTYGGPVTLTATPSGDPSIGWITLHDPDSITFNDTITGTSQGLSSNNAGTTTFNGDVNIEALYVGGATAINGTTTITTAGFPLYTSDQTYDGPVLFGSDANITLSGVNLQFNGAIDSYDNDNFANLTLNTTGYTGSVFTQDVGSNAPLASLTVNATDGYALFRTNPISVTTIGDQTYNATYGTWLDNGDSAMTFTSGGTVYLSNGVWGAGNPLTIAQYNNGDSLVGGNLSFNGGENNYSFTFGTLTVPGIATVSLAGDTTFNFDAGSITTILGISDTGGTFAGNDWTLTIRPDFTLPATITGPDDGFDGSLIFNGNITLNQDSSIIVRDGYSVTFNETVDGNFNLTTNAHANGSVYFLNNVGGDYPILSLTTTGNTYLGYSNNLYGSPSSNEVIYVTTSGSSPSITDQDYNGPVWLGSGTSAVLSGVNILFNDIVNSNDGDNFANLTLNTTGYNGAIITQDVGINTPLGSLAVTATDGYVIFQSNPISVQTSGDQTYNAAYGTWLNNGGSAMTFTSGGTVYLHNGLGGGDNLLTIARYNTGDDYIGGNLVFGGGGYTFGTLIVPGVGAATVSLDGNTTWNFDPASISNILSMADSNGDFFGNYDALTIQPSITLPGLITGPDGFFTAFLTFNGDVSLFQDTTINVTDGYTVTFNGNVDGAYNFTVSAGNGGDDGPIGSVYFNSVGLTTPLASLTVNGYAGTDGGGFSFNTTGNQHFNNGFPNMNTGGIINATGPGAMVTFGGSVGTGQEFRLIAGTADSPGTAQFISTINTFSLTIGSAGDGGVATIASLGGDVTTTSGQSYNGPVQIMAGYGEGITLTSGNYVSFNSTVDGWYEGGQNLTVNANSGDSPVAFGGPVGTNRNLGNINITGSTIDLFGNVSTTNGQTYNGSVRLNTDITFTDNTYINFGNTVDSFDATPRSLILNAGYGVYFYGSLGCTNPLNILSITGATVFGTYTSIIYNAEGSSFYGTVNTVGGQTYNSPMYNEVDMTFTDQNDTLSNSSVVFNTVDGYGNFDGPKPLAGQTVTVVSGTIQDPGTVTFNGGVGNNIVIGDVIITGNTTFADNVGEASLGIGALLINNNATLNGNITTTGGQTYGGAVTIMGEVFLNSNANTITFNSTLDGWSDGENTLNLFSDAIFENSVGSLASFYELNAVAVTMNGGSVTTVENQSYYGLVTLGVGTTLTAGGAVYINGGVAGGGNDLTVDSTLQVTPDFTDLNSLVVTGDVSLSGNVITSGNQTYNGSVVLYDEDRTLTSTDGNIQLQGGVSGNGNALTTSGDLYLGTLESTKLFTGLSSLSWSVLHPYLAGNIVVDGMHTLSNYTGLNSPDAGTLLYSLMPADGGSYGIEITADIGLSSTLGSSQNFTYLQFDSTVTLGGNVNLIAESVLLNTVNSDPHDLTITGGAIFQGPLTVNNLTVTGTTTMNYSPIITTGNQTYQGAMSLGQDTTLQAGDSNSVTIGDVDTSNDGHALTLLPNAVITGDLTGLTSFTVGNVDLPGTTALGGSVSTVVEGDSTGDQTYWGPVNLTVTPITLTSGGGIYFKSTLEGASDLILNVTTTIDLAAGAGATYPPLSLTIDGAISLENDVVIANSQVYADTTITTTDAMSLVHLVANSGTITVNGTVKPAGLYTDVGQYMVGRDTPPAPPPPAPPAPGPAQNTANGITTAVSTSVATIGTSVITTNTMLANYRMEDLASTDYTSTPIYTLTGTSFGGTGVGGGTYGGTREEDDEGNPLP